MTWLVAFAWTLALELPVYTRLLARHVRDWRRLCLAVLAINALTHPLLWFAFPRLEPFWVFALAGEGCVIVVEAALLALVVPPRVAVVASLAANTISTLLGFVVMRAIA